LKTDEPTASEASVMNLKAFEPIVRTRAKSGNRKFAGEFRRNNFLTSEEKNISIDLNDTKGAGMGTFGSKKSSGLENSKDIKIYDSKGFNNISEIVKDGNDFISVNAKSRNSDKAVQQSGYIQEINKVYPVHKITITRSF